ncbi:uncharacterized protein AB675_174 [Cyphellophora attinorum]|uniref:Spindle pole body-associated protein cut12 domain-containing protein n=1 Tax=Cyphellophora attinorum TaxID=1664694 RepID=A0A0N1NYX2_9EURO|nr:uncharacterized protein AB675_174 [Phialophora attinorum]KPI37715.1 hypothetical protein AB675_174 [Phialophora attinorum]
MASEETLISFAPVTPAHKFAWRALRGFVYGSPESPEIDNNLVPGSVGSGKENARPVSPSLKKIILEGIPTLASPQKRKRSDAAPAAPQLSPTKSILRTPGGAPTPRAKSLRDVNVKFKSVSPEVMAVKQRNATAPVLGKVDVVSLEKEIDELQQELEASIDGGKKNTAPDQAHVVSKKVRKTSKQTTVSDIMPATAHDPEREAYQRRTEMEVKQILRHQKKIKDYAKRADEQNVILKGMVAELKAENARLKARLEEKERIPVNGGNSGGPTKEATTDVSDRGSRRDRKAPLGARVHADQAADALSRTEAFKRSLRGQEAIAPEASTDSASLPHRPKTTTLDTDSASRRRRRPSIHVHEDPKPIQSRPDDKGNQQVHTTRSDNRDDAGREPATRPASPVNRSVSIRSTDRPRVRSRNSPPSLTVLLSEQLEQPAEPPRPSARNCSSRQPSTSIPKTSASGTTIDASDRPSIEVADSLHAVQPLDQPSTATRVAAVTTLAPDRATAARLRLEKRRERARLGLVGNGTSLAFAGMFTGADHGREKQSALEESAVDWAGL